MSKFIGDMIEEEIPAISPSRKLQQLNINGRRVAYSNADFEDLKGKVVAFYYIAAQQGTDKLQASLVDAIDAEQFSTDDFVNVTVLNVDDAMFGTAGLAKTTFEGRSKAHGTDDRIFWLDSKSVIRDAWDLDSKSAAHIILDQDNNVLAAYEGKVGDDEIAEALEIISDHIG